MTSDAPKWVDLFGIDPDFTGDQSAAFPFTTPDGSDARMFIQWKGTNVCLDFYCPCGAEGHVEQSFAYAIECPSCGAIYELGTQVIAKRDDNYGGNIVTMTV